MSERQVVIPRFVVLRRGQVVRTLPISRNHMIVGSEEGAHLRLKHPAIAPRHLEVKVVDGRYLEGANLAGEGRVLLGNQPMDRARLRDGDELDLGPVILRLIFEVADESETTELGFDDDDDDDDDDEEGTIEDRAPIPAAASVPPRPPPKAKKKREFDASATLSSLKTLFVGESEEETEESSPLAVELDDIPLDPCPIVVIEPPGGRIQRVPLRVGSFVIGTGRCAFRLSYPGVAPAHAEVLVMPDGMVYVKHLAGSSLPTLRNGAPFQFSRWSKGDRLQVGPVAVRLEMEKRTGPVIEEEVPTAEAKAPYIDTHDLPALDLAVASPAALTAEPAGGGLTPPLPPADLGRLGARAEAPTQPPSPPSRSPEPPSRDRPPVVPPASVQKEDKVPPTFASDRLPPLPGAASQAPPAPAPSSEQAPAIPLVRVKAQPGKAKADRRRRGAPIKPSIRHSVEISLDVSTYDTFRAIEAEYRKPFLRREGGQLLILLLLLIVGFQVANMLGLLEGFSSGSSVSPQTAQGDSGLVETTDLEAVGSGPVVVGSRRGKRRTIPRSSRGGAGIDWDDSRSGRIEFEERRADASAMRALLGSEFEAIPVDAGDPAPPRPEDEVERQGSDDTPQRAAVVKQGFVEMKRVDQAIYSGNRKLRYCYEKARSTDESLEGILWLSLTLATDGRIRGVVAEPRSTLKSDSMTRCLERQLFSLSMPQPEGGSVTFSYPFEFHPSD